MPHIIQSSENTVCFNHYLLNVSSVQPLQIRQPVLFAQGAIAIRCVKEEHTTKTCIVNLRFLHASLPCRDPRQRKVTSSNQTMTQQVPNAQKLLILKKRDQEHAYLMLLVFKIYSIAGQSIFLRKQNRF